jgi:hypothetical protein
VEVTEVSGRQASRIVSVDLDGGEARTIYELPAVAGQRRLMTRLRLDPTGRYLSFVAGGTLEEIWLMEGLRGGS